MVQPSEKDNVGMVSDKTLDIPLMTSDSVKENNGYATIDVNPIPKKMTPLQGKIGNYELLEEIARGGMGVVYKARQQSLNRIVALKMILSGSQATTEDIERFSLEARAAANLDHPNIVQVYDTGCHEGQHYFTMAFIEGTSLSGLLKDRNIQISYKEIATIVASLADAVQYAHEQNIIHRDLKPENVLVDSQGRARITDFGLARRLEVDNRLTASGRIMGTPSFMSPEQARGISGGPPIDIYALGGILYFLLTGLPPFDGNSLMEVLNRVAELPPVPPRKIKPTVPPGLEAICLKCLEKDPNRRYASAGVLADLLRDWATKNASLEPEKTQRLSDRIKAAKSAGGAAPVTQANTMPQSAAVTSLSSPSTRIWPWFVGTGLVAGVLAAVGYSSFGSHSPANHPKENTVANIPGEKSPDNKATVNTQPVINVSETTKKDETKVVQISDKGPKIPWEEFLGRKEMKNDFGLKVTMGNSRPDDRGEYSLVEGMKVNFQIELEKEAYVGIWSIDPDGTVTQIFPNEFEKDNFVRPNGKKIIPVNSNYSFVPERSTGLEHIWIVASSKRWNPTQGEQVGPYMAFHKKQDQEKWAMNQRGLLVVPELSEQIMPYRVNPAKE